MLVPVIKFLRINAIQMTHSIRPIAINSFDQHMIMIRHLATGITTQLNRLQTTAMISSHLCLPSSPR